MTQNEFVKLAVGLPWIRWRSDWDGCDCYGLVVLFYREVLGIALPGVPKTEFEQGLPDVMPSFERIDKPTAGACAFMSFVGGRPTHCGIYLGDGMVIHAHGSESVIGSTRICKLETIKKIFGEVKFYAVINK